MRIKKTLIYITIVILWYLISCDFQPIDPPELPRWFTKLNIPLIDKSYPMSDLAGDSADTSNPIIIGLDSTLQFHFEGQIDTAQISKENLKIPAATSINFANEIPSMSDIGVDTTITMNNSFLLTDLINIPIDGAPIPPIDPDTIIVDTVRQEGPFFPDSIPFFKNMLYLNIQDGSITTRIVNNLPDPMELTRVHVRVQNDLNEYLSTTGADQTIPSGDSLVQNSSLANTHLTNNLSFDISLYVHSTDTATYVAADSPGVIFEISFSITTIDSAVGTVDTIRKTFTYPISQENNRIQYGVIDDTLSPDFSLNKMKYRISNDIPLDIDFSLQFVNFIDHESGQAINIRDTLASSGGVALDTLLLNSDTLRAEIAGNYVDSLKFIAVITLLPNHGDTLVAIPVDMSGGSITFDMSMTDIQLKKLTGLINASFELPPQTISNIPTGFGKVAFSQVWIEIILHNEIEASTILNLNLVGRRGAEEVTQKIEGTIRSAQNDSTASVDTLRANIADIFNLVPDSIFISGAASVPTDTTSTIQYGKRVFGIYSIDVPFYVSLDTMIFIPVLTNRVEPMDSATAEQINSSLISAGLITEITNNSTLSGKMDLLISNLNFFPYYNIPDSFYLPRGDTLFFMTVATDSTVDSLVFGIDENGDTIQWKIDTLVTINLPTATLESDAVKSPGTNFSEAIMDSSVVEFLTEQNAHYIVPRIEMYGTGSDTVQVSARDFIHITAFISFVLDMEAIISPGEDTTQVDTSGSDSTAIDTGRVLLKPISAGNKESIPIKLDVHVPVKTPD